MSQVNYQTLKHSSAPAPIHWDATLHYKIKSHLNTNLEIYEEMYQLVPQIDPSGPQPVFTITEKAPTRAFSWLKAPTSHNYCCLSDVFTNVYWLSAP